MDHAAKPDSRLPLSIAIVCKNSGATIGRTLESVRGLAREVVALDSGSTDGTIGLLVGAGARVERVEWEGYVRTKQRAVEACAQEWVMILDSDESIEPDLAASLRGALGGAAGDPSIGGFAVNRKVWYRGRFLEHAWQPEWRTRIVRASLLRSGEALVTGVDPHDQLSIRASCAARTARLSGTLRHDTIADMARFLTGQVSLAAIGAEQRASAGGRGSAWRLIGSPAGALFKQVVLRSAWRDGWRGWAAAGATACHAMMKQVVLMERAGSKGENRT